MSSETLMDRFQGLIARYSYLGITSDIAGLTLVELWGLYRYLNALNGGGQ